MWRIEQLNLSDFKSYKGIHSIPQFHNFQAVIGPNGAGKSNLMDAISFVLGVRVGFLRGSNLKDLIHDDPTMDTPPTRASVELKLRHNTGDEKIYKRTVMVSGSSEYRIDNKVVTEKEYQSQLRDINIDVKARNFLVFQGDVSQVASKSGKELTKMIESICGSDELSKEYDDLKLKKEKAEEQTMTCFQKKKGMNAEKRQYKAMKEEAEKYQTLEDEMAEKKKELMLVDIRNYKKGMAKYKNEMEEKNESLEGLITEKTGKEMHFEKSAENVRNKENEEHSKRDELRKLKGERENMKPMEGRTQAKRKILYEKLKKAEKEMKEVEKRNAEEKERIAKLENEKAEMEKLMKDVEHTDNVMMTEKQKKTFEKMNEAYLSRCGEKERRKDELILSITRDEEVVKELGNVEDVKVLKEKIEAIQTQIGKYDESIEKEKEEQKSDEEELEKMRGALQEKNANLERVSHALKETDETMSELRMSLKENQHEILMNETMDNLKRLFSKVYGQVNELYTANNKRQSDTISLAIGKYNKAVVVEDTQTAIECLKYCKEQRTKIVLTFLCLKELRSKDFYELDDNLKSLGASFVYNNIKFSDKYDSVFRFVLNNTLIVDTLKTARKIAFNQRYKHMFRIVTSIGSVVEKNSLMVGGSQQKKRTKKNAKKAQEEYNELSAKKIELEEEMAQLQSVKETNLEDFQLRINGHKHRIEMLEKRKSEVEADREKSESEVKKYELKSKGKDVKEVKKRILSNKDEMNSIEKDILEQQTAIFKELNEELGIENVYLMCSNKSVQEREKKRFTLEQNIKVIDEKIRIEQEKDTKQTIEDQKKEVEKIQQEINEKIEKVENELKEKIRRNEELVLEKSGELAQIVRDEEKLKGEMSEKKKEFEEVENQIRQTQKDQSHLQSMYGKLQAGLDETVRSARMEQIELPIVGKGDSKSDSKSPDKSSKEGTQNTLQMMEIVTQSTTYAETEFDFSSIEKIKVRNMEEYNAVRTEMTEEIAKLEAKINGLTPNMKAIDQFNGIVDKLKDINDDFEEVRKEAKNASDLFNEVKLKRTKMFMEAFDHISSAIDPIYKELTKSSKHPLGGTAFLSLENTEEPYLSGLKYNAMPPFKRFHDLEQLSGGEKTIAALALLFAIQSFYPSPFFILDEIDAALDVQNVLQVAKYIQKKCNDVQFLVISLKDTLYERADALVGVARDLEKKTSVIYTLDLKDYEF
ncbi:structural maintenance of chromosomes protein, putative [Entamoeba invadens IP1]|uniref:Structural maintenance of chromosomes protein n=1 Tax=Entamoeba invadens IP1 TaxID=370355 RepID=A0A0A1UBA5_ENTIV|nr:structural maintenance of chromosomes protein, putative [Entamoeba invadens IP1]ELP90891.1 structural maintenance of chromosomes protein, putative [Entamoeba invadens IP1]|eukprot:XP_004257662.1 structural maintenance of chromosomes protein, putative [Entamoeba invadens IP1]